MAKYETIIQGSFNKLLETIETRILSGSVSASLEDGSDYENDGVRCAVRVYERYSMIGKNRVSMNVTLIGKDDALFLSAITSGGSQAVFFKINTFGEEAFLEKIKEIAESYKRENG
ncbi:MAG: DUF6054 family protein [Clostridia bacterium]|nr:DUF6054 family protein [Clostridia bacterium]